MHSNESKSNREKFIKSLTQEQKEYLVKALSFAYNEGGAFNFVRGLLRSLDESR